MKYFLGIDGGGTKTDFLLCDSSGAQVAHVKTGPCRDEGGALIADTFSRALEQIKSDSGITLDGVSALCFGMPGYGENEPKDKLVKEQVKAWFPGVCCTMVNDVEVGWAGALALSPGIDVVSGTGSIAFGRDDAGKTARAGGWWSNEGSGWWLGYKTIELFLKQLDGRANKTPIYYILWDAFKLKKNEDIFEYTTENLSGNRKNIAHVQTYLDKAADIGDQSALKLYAQAGTLLADLAIGCASQLKFEGRPRASYTGSVFKAGDKLLKPFSQLLATRGIEIVPPALEPVEGAALLAIRAKAPLAVIDAVNNIKAGKKLLQHE